MDSLLLLLLDSRAPVGAHGHSGGMEAAITAGIVRDLDDVAAFCAGRLRTAGRVAAGFAAAACRAWSTGLDPAGWRRLDDELTARTAAEAERVASRALGRGLVRLLAAMVPEADAAEKWRLIERPAPHQALVLGAAVSIAGGRPELAARAAALGICTAPGVAGIRLLGLDPYEVHAVLARLAPAVEAVAADAAAIAAEVGAGDLPCDAAPAVEILADVHATREVRLFAS